MSKLYFRYGAMKSAKTTILISIKTSYERQHKSVFCAKPDIDTRSGQNSIKSRIIERPEWADMLITPTTSYHDLHKIAVMHMKAQCALVDEAQFLTSQNVEFLRVLTKKMPVICFGLRTNYLGYLFEGSKRLLELADCIEEVKSCCYKCDRKATMNLRHNPTGPEIVIGDEEYSPACWSCWGEYMREHNQLI